ncbi:hypothetical protein OSSY52_00770 [Tepiditoga spiralis]|uniref:Uncharacterized protein n=1 Tax=Tepiditoga spiralis TaxID=2108365 RepID=A0A7G1G405_9BACT|nr:hypothetical protein [Tepiditoga spiralis]BBE29936.1 hypothetical protein OSSY52_00770 [Tepiditoga spiralis]
MHENLKEIIELEKSDLIDLKFKEIVNYMKTIEEYFKESSEDELEEAIMLYEKLQELYVVANRKLEELEAKKKAIDKKINFQNK